MTNSVQAWQRRMGFHGALMLWITMIYGLYLVGVMTDLVPGNEAMTLGAHINGLMGAFWLLGLGWSLSFVRLSERLLSIAVWMTLAGAWFNFLLAMIKAVPGVMAIEFTGGAFNDVVFVARLLLVVIPSLVGPALWVWGLRAHSAAGD
jgi:hydroxylaminobenzene mutase